MVLVVIIIYLIVVLSFKYFSYDVTYENIDEYEEYIEKVTMSNTLLPTEEELKNSENVQVYYHEKNGFIAYTYYTISLFLQYNDDDYLVEKSKILEEHNFISEPIVRNDIVYLHEPSFEYAGFKISVVDNVEYTYLKNYGMVGFNDETNSIVYLFVYDPEIGFISDETIQDYLESYFIFEYNTEELVLE